MSGTYGVGAERAAGDGLVAHAVKGADTDSVARYGTAVCGFPGNHLTVVPDLFWPDVLPTERCRFCVEELGG